MRRLANICFAFALAIAGGVYVGIWEKGTVLGVFCLLASVFLFVLYRDRPYGHWLLGLGLGMIYVTVFYQHNIRPIKQLANTETVLTACLEQTPERTDYGYRAAAQISVNGISGKVIVYGDDAGDLTIGDCVTAKFRIEDSQLRYDDQDLYYQAKDISLICYQRDEATITKAGKLPLRLLPVKIGEELKHRIFRTIPERSAGFVQALLTGDRSKLSYQTRSDLSRSGIMHTVAVSGMHVSVLLSMVLLLCGKSRRLASILGVPIVLIFMAVTGFSPSVVRAGIMQLILLLAPLLRREGDWQTALAFSLALILIENPWAIASVSLQLSYGAVIGIALFSSRAYNRMQWKLPKHLQPVGNYVTASLATTFGALALTIPISAIYFGMVSLIGFVTNLLTLFAVSLCFTCGLLAVLVGMIFLPLGKLLALGADYPAQYLLFVVRLLAKLPYAAVSTNQLPIAIWLGVSYGIGILLLLWRGKKPVLIAACCVTISLCVGIFANIGLCRIGTASITAVNVGQGQCMILTNNSFAAMIDCGGNGDYAGEAAASFLEQAGRMRLDALILTHFDSDHTNGLQQLLHRIRVGTVFLPDVYDDHGNRDRIEALLAAHNVQVVALRENICAEFSTAQLKIFAPQIANSDNNEGLSVLANLDGLQMLDTGDMDTLGEFCLLEEALPQVDVLVAGHHGAASSTGDALLERVDPQAVLISVGRNSYGHPSEKTIERIKAIGAQVYRTDLLGNITIWR